MFIVYMKTFFESKYLRLRSSAKQLYDFLYDKIDSEEPILFDFSEVEFVSRSFIEELMKRFKMGNIKFVNTNEMIENMISFVKSCSNEFECGNCREYLGRYSTRCSGKTTIWITCPHCGSKQKLDF